MMERAYMPEDHSDKPISISVAYKCMYEFLAAYADRVNSDEVNGLLGGMALLADGGTADSAMLEDWKDAVQAVLKAEADGGYTKANFRLQ